MGNYLKVSRSGMERDADYLKELLDTIPQLITDLEQGMYQLSSCWEGPA